MFERTLPSMAETAAYYHQLLLIHILERIQFGMTEGYPQPKGNGYARPPFFIFGTGLPRAFLEAVVGIEPGPFGKAIDELLQRKLIDECRPKQTWPFHNDLEFYVHANHAIRLIHTSGPPNLDPFSSDVGLAVKDDPQANGHRVRAVSKRKIEGHWKEHPYQTWHALDCGPFYAVNAAGLAYVDQWYKETGEEPFNYSWGYPYKEIRGRADADTQRIIADANKNAKFPWQLLFDLVCAAYQKSVALLHMVRGNQPRRAQEFVSNIERLISICEAIKIEAPKSVSHWPTSPATIFAAWSHDSALEVIVRFARAMESTGHYARSCAAGEITDESGRLVCNGGHIPPDLLVSEHIPHPLLESWLQHFVKHVDEAVFPPRDKWAIWEMNRDVAALESKLRDELQRASQIQNVTTALEQNPQTSSADYQLGGPAAAAHYYAELTLTKVDRSNARRRLQNPSGEYWISHIADVAFRSLKRRGLSKRKQAVHVSEELSYCSSCKSMVPAGVPLWRNLRLCHRCMVEFSGQKEGR